MNKVECMLSHLLPAACHLPSHATTRSRGVELHPAQPGEVHGADAEDTNEDMTHTTLVATVFKP